MATKVTLRHKSISKGRQSLYLDFYPPILNPKTGEPTRREFLGMYAFERPRNSVDKQHNADQLRIAEQVRQKRENELNKQEVYTEFERERLRLKELGEIDFVDYFRKQANKRKASSHDNWMSALNYLETFTGGSLKFADLNERVINEFKEYLLTTKSKKSDKVILSQNSALSYFNKVKAALNQAYRDGILQVDLNARIAPIKAEETRREYLTMEELNTLAKTPCNDDVLRRAALFSALTGLRFSDIQKMTWKELEYIEGQGYFLNFSQKKTKGVEVLPISEQAYSFCGERGEPAAQVFDGLVYSAYHNKHLYEHSAQMSPRVRSRGICIWMPDQCISQNDICIVS